MLCIPSRLSNETFIWFDSWTKNNHFLLGKMVEVLGGVISSSLNFWNLWMICLWWWDMVQWLKSEFRRLNLSCLVWGTATNAPPWRWDVVPGFPLGFRQKATLWCCSQPDVSSRREVASFSQGKPVKSDTSAHLLNAPVLFCCSVLLTNILTSW